jgi:hypothetical protein
LEQSDQRLYGSIYLYVILTTIAVDPATGVVALAWGDTRGSVTNEEVNHYGVFLDPRELN